MKMNARLKAYLRSLGLSAESDDNAAWEFFRSLRGLQATLANCLNYSENDEQARTSCDLALRSLGVDPTNPSEMLETRSQTTPTTPGGDDGASLSGDLEAAAAQRGAQAERARRTAIEQYADIAGCSDELRRELLDGTQTAEQARDRIWEDHRSRTRAEVPADVPGQAPAGHTRQSGSTPQIAVLQAAMLHARNLDPTTQWATTEANPRFQRMTPELERAIEEGYQYRRASLEDVIRMCAAIDGVSLPTGRQNLLQTYFRGVSTAALSAVYTANVNSELLSAFMVAEDTTTGGWVRESDVSDFRTNERARLENGGALKKLPRGGEAEHATYSDAVESFKIARYAAQFVIDDQDVQDDNFGGLTGFVPADMGVAARQLRADLIYSILIGNPDMRDSTALFHGDHNNLAGSAAFADATLGAARKAMRIQTESGRNLNIVPRFLIVPPALEDAADVLVNSRTVETGASVTIGNRNPHAGKGIQVVSDARLENGVIDPTDATGATIHSGSATTWFMSADAQSHTIECAYLRGTGRAPQITPFILTEGRWGLGWAVKMDVGAKALDWRGLLKRTSG